MKKLFLLLVCGILSVLSAKAQFTSLINDDIGDGQSGTSMDGEGISYFWDTDTDSIYFRVNVDAIQTAGFDIHIGLNIEGAGATADWTGQQNTSFKYNRMVTVSAQLVGTTYVGIAGVADPAGVGADDYTNISNKLFFDLGADFFILGLRRKTLYDSLDTKADVIASVGPFEGWNDDIPTSGSGKLNIKGIRKPVVQVFSPEGGEEWEAGQDKIISWISYDIYNIRLEYNTDTTSNEWKLIEATVPAKDGSYEWEVPNDQSETVRLKISDADSLEIFAISKPFSILHSSSISGINILPRALKVYPVPSSTGMVYLSLHDNYDLSARSSVKVFNMSGQEVYSRDLTGVQELKNYPIDLGALENGVYMLQLSNGRDIAVSRVVMTRE